MNKGIIYHNIIYPGYIGLEKGSNFFFKFNNEYHTLLILDHVKVLYLADYDNEIVSINSDNKKIKRPIEQKISNKSATLSQHNIPKITVDFDGKSKRVIKDIYHTSVIIAGEIDNVNSPVIDAEYLKNVMSFFLKIYRIQTNDQDILLPSIVNFFNPVNYHSIHSYTKEELLKTQKERMTINRDIPLQWNQISINKIDQFINNIPSHDFKKLDNDLQEAFKKNVQIEEASSFLMELDGQLRTQSNSKQLFLDLFIFIEMIVYKFLYEKKRSLGASKTKLDKYEKELTMSYMLNVELQIYLQPSNDIEKEIIGKIDRLRDLRNKVVHKGRDISFEELLEARNDANNLFKLIRSKKAAT